MENTTTTTTVTPSTTTATTTMTPAINTTTIDPQVLFDEIPGKPFGVYEMAAVDWDEVYDGSKLGPRPYTTWNALNIVRLGLATWVLASHVAIIVFIIGKRVLRTQPKNLLIVNVALANILLGVFVVPVKLHFILNPEIVECDLAMGWTFITHYFQTSVSLFAVFSLVFERFIYVYAEKKQKNVLPLALRLGTVVLFIFPWIISCLFLLPTFFAAFHAKHFDDNLCLYKIDEVYFLVCQILSFALPSLGVFILAPFTGLLDCLRPSRCFYRPLTPKGESMIVTAAVSLFSIFCEAPYCVVMILMMLVECNNPYCTRFSEALTLTMWVRICKSALFPFIWLFYTDIRDAMKCHWDWDSSSDSDLDDEDDVDNFRHEEQTLEKRQAIPLTSTSASSSAGAGGSAGGAGATPH